MKGNNQKTTTTKEITQNVFLHTSKMSLKNTEDLAHTLYTYTVEVKEITLVDITLDFSGGKNIKIENQPGLEASTTIKPMSSQIVAVVRAYDVEWSTPCKIRMSKRSPSLDEQRVFIKQDVEKLAEDLRFAQNQWRSFPLKVASQDKFQAQIRKNGTNFIDIDFPPLERSIQDPAKGSSPFDRVVHWRRPREFMLPDPTKGLFEPQVFEKSIDPNDILQGQLGDCWLLCAISCLAEMPHLVERIILTQEYNEEGIYRVKICKNGEWQEISIDDYFPCFPNGSPIFSRGQGNELWVLLLEKAFAKVHGSYRNIVGGQPHEAMMDLTGCPTATYSFKDQKVIEMVKNGKLWTLLKHYDKEGYVMSGGTPGQDMWTEAGGTDQKGGLVPGHAYSIIQAQEYKGIKLLQIRNPWGGFEWDGDWSDNSPLWTEDMIKAFNPVFDEADGTFWMSFEDFTKQFESLDVCRVTSWDELRLRGRFIRFYDVNDQENEVVVSKWIYGLEVPSKTHIVIGLHQEDERIEGTLPRRPYIDFGLAILKRDPEGSQLIHFKESAISRNLELECILEPGSYIVVPRTTGCGIRRPLDAYPENVRLINDKGEPNELFLSTIGDIFRKFDLVISNTIDFKEFKGIYDIIGKKITELEFKQQILEKYNSIEDAITLKGLTQWFLEQVQIEGEDTVFGWLEKLGYDKDLYSVRSRLFNITFHSKSIEPNGESMGVKIRDAVGTDLDNYTNKLILQENGKDIEKGEGFRIVELAQPEIYGWTYGVVNDSDHPIVATLDLTGSNNLMFSTKHGVAKKTLQPRECHFMLHAQAGIGEFSKKVTSTVQHLPKKK